MHSFLQMGPEERLQHFNVLAREALVLYDLPGDADIRLLNHSENTTYLVESNNGNGNGNGKAILRINRPGYHTEEVLHSELEWLSSLDGASKVVTAKPIAGNNGAYIQSIEKDMFAEKLNCVMFEFLSGQAPEENVDTLVAEFEKLGKVTADLHLHVKSWSRAGDIVRPVWDFEHTIGSRGHWGRWQEGLSMTPEREALFGRAVKTIEKRLAAYGKGSERFGLIHADLRLANLLVEDGTVKVIDFDDCGFGWYVYDLAAAISFIEHEPYIPDLIAAWLRGYRSEAELPEEDEAEIPTFVMLRRLLLVAWMGTHSEVDIAREIGHGYTASTVPLVEAYLEKFE